MSQLYDYTAEEEITEYISGEIDQDVNIIEHTALDGTYYQQIIGSPTLSYVATAYVDSAGRSALQAAQAHGNVLRVTIPDQGVFYGRITKGGLQLSDRNGSSKWYKASLRLAKEDT